MISEGSCDTEVFKLEICKFAITGINYFLKYIKTENIFLYNVSQYYYFYCILIKSM